MTKYSGSTVLTKIFQLFKSKLDSLSIVASSGSYNDLTDKPTVITIDLTGASSVESRSEGGVDA